MNYPAHPDDTLVERFVRPRPRTCWAIKIEFFYGQWMVIWPDKNVEFYSDKDLDATFETEHL